MQVIYVKWLYKTMNVKRVLLIFVMGLAGMAALAGYLHAWMAHCY